MAATIQTMARKNRQRLAALEARLDYRFKEPILLQRALIHSSFAFEQGMAGQDNETLEFLGDAVLDLAVGLLLFQKYPKLKEGELTRLRAALVNEAGLAGMARGIGLGETIFLGKGEDATSGRQKPSILSGSYEALIGAIFLDSGYDTTAALVERFFAPLIKGRKEDLLVADAKSRLQEKIQEQYNEAPTYSVEKEEGPAHDRQFTVAVRFQGQVLASGRAGSKKEAEQQAAAAALQDLDRLLPAVAKTG
ncbi:MAG: ribonuclease III [Desulfobacterales bacterium]|nr:ribonuclease III [Desulfobacterales bacterium]